MQPLAISIGIVFIRLGQSAVLAVRDVLAKHLEGRRVKLQFALGKTKVSYEGPLSEKQRDELMEVLKKLVSDPES